MGNSPEKNRDSADKSSEESEPISDGSVAVNDDRVVFFPPQFPDYARIYLTEKFIRRAKAVILQKDVLVALHDRNVPFVGLGEFGVEKFFGAPFNAEINGQIDFGMTTQAPEERGIDLYRVGNQESDFYFFVVHRTKWESSFSV